MTDETKRIFDAPWAVEEKQSETFGEVFDVMDEDLYLHYARCYDEKTANRLARLPELYDALAEAAVKYCPELGSNFDSCDTCSVKNCEVREWVNLLKKVKEGK